MKFTVVPDEQRSEVPDLLQETIDYLNELLAMDRKAISRALGSDYPCNRALVDDPTCVVVDANGNLTISAVGVIGGLVNRDAFRLAAYYDDDDLTNIVRFVAVRATVEKEEVL